MIAWGLSVVGKHCYFKDTLTRTMLAYAITYEVGTPQGLLHQMLNNSWIGPDSLLSVRGFDKMVSVIQAC